MSGPQTDHAEVDSASEDDRLEKYTPRGIKRPSGKGVGAFECTARVRGWEMGRGDG
jgi:hypothetical protein